MLSRFSVLSRTHLLPFQRSIRQFGKNTIQKVTNDNYQLLAYSYQANTNYHNKGPIRKIQVTPELSPDKFIDFVDILEEEYKTVPIDTMVFWDRSLSYRQIEKLSEAFSKRLFPRLKYLNFDTDMNASFLQELLESLNKGNIKIITLEIDGNHQLGTELHHLNPTTIQESCSTLQHLCMDDIQMNDESMNLFSQFYQQQYLPKLTSFYCRDNQIHSDSMSTFIHSIINSQLVTLSTLGLSLNPIDSSFIKDLIDVFKQNQLPHLKCLHALFPTISTELLYELQYTYCHECYPLDMEAAKQSVFYRK